MLTERHVPRCVCGAGSWLGRPLLPTDVVPQRGPAGHGCSCIPAAVLFGVDVGCRVVRSWEALQLQLSLGLNSSCAS